MIDIKLPALLAIIATSTAMSGCESQPKQPGADFEEARAKFASRGVQPGQPLPPLSLVDLDGRPADIRRLQGDRPLVLITASLTCNVARRQQPQLESLRERFGDSVAFAVVYTIDAHPKGDACPYLPGGVPGAGLAPEAPTDAAAAPAIGREWVPKANERDRVLVRQPVDMHGRIALAREYQQRMGMATPILVDTMDNASWSALGKAPNLGLLIDRNGIVRARQGWFEPKEMEAALHSTNAPEGRSG